MSLKICKSCGKPIQKVWTLEDDKQALKETMRDVDKAMKMVYKADSLLRGTMNTLGIIKHDEVYNYLRPYYLAVSKANDIRITSYQIKSKWKLQQFPPKQ